MSKQSKISVTAMLMLSAALVGIAQAQEGAAEVTQAEATGASIKQVVTGAGTLTQVHVREVARTQVYYRGAAVTHVESSGTPITQVSSEGRRARSPSPPQHTASVKLSALMWAPRRSAWLRPAAR